jgi:hypothetical protein
MCYLVCNNFILTWTGPTNGISHVVEFVLLIWRKWRRWRSANGLLRIRDYKHLSIITKHNVGANSVEWSTVKVTKTVSPRIRINCLV